MRNKLLISILSLLFALHVFGQEKTFYLKQNSISKKPPKLKELKVKLIAKDLGNSRFSITSEIVKNEGNYRLYMIDESETKNMNASAWEKVADVHNWFRTRVFGASFSVDNYKNEIKFNGKFIDYNSGRLKRKEWNRGYNTLDQKAIDEYTVIGSRAGANDDLFVSYTFLFIERAADGSQALIGISEAIKFIISDDIVSPSDAIAEQQVEKQSPTDIAQYWDKKIKEELLVTFLTEECFNYQQVNANPELRNIYRLEKYSGKIEQEIDNVNTALAASKYTAKREELISLLKAFQESDINVAEVTDKKNQAPDKSKQNKKQASVVKKGNKYDKLKSKYAGINTKLRKTRENIDFLQYQLVKDKISDLRDRLNLCNGRKDCINNIQEEFELIQREWDVHINEHTRVLNAISYDLSSLEADKDFKESGIPSNEISTKIMDLKNRNSKLEQDIMSFGREIESNLINKSVYANISSLYTEELKGLSADYKRIKSFYTKTEQKYWDTAELSKSEIKALNDASRVSEQIKSSVETILKKAGQRYKDETGQASFPEAIFIDEFDLPTKADCESLNSNMERLANDAEKTEKRGGWWSNMLIIGVLLVLLIGAYFYFRSIISGKVKRQKLATAHEFNSGNGDDGIAEGMEILEDNEEKNKGKGLELVYKLNKIKYHEIDVQSLLEDTAVRKVYMSDEFIIDAYQYFEDKMLEVGRDNLDSLYEYGGFIIGKWDISPYSDEQYDVSLEHFIKPGDDAKFTKFNIDFGYEISFRMESKLIDLAKKGNEQVLVGWLHSHPGHDIFLSNYDLEVQETFRNQYHPNRHIALVLEPTTDNWDLGLFSFNRAGIMNNKEEMKSVLGFHKLYDWALGKYVAERSSNHFRFEEFGREKSGRIATSFDKSALSQMKIIAEREFAIQKNTSDIYYFWGVKVDAGKSGTLLHAIDVKQFNENEKPESLQIIGGYGVYSGASPLESIPQECIERLNGTMASFFIIYLSEEDKFLFITLTEGNISQARSHWKEFAIKDMLPFLNDSSITV